MVISSDLCETNPSVRVVSLEGRVGVTESDELKAVLEKAIEQAEAAVVVDMAAMDFISSAALRVLVTAQSKAQAANKKIAFYHLQANVYKMFKLSALDELFVIYDTESDALQGLAAE